MKKWLTVAFMLLSSASFADYVKPAGLVTRGEWIETCNPAGKVLMFARSEIGNEEFNPRDCDVKQEVKSSCTVSFKDTGTTLGALILTHTNLSDKVIHVVRLQAKSGNTYVFEVESFFKFFETNEGSYCKSGKVKLVDFF